MVNCEVSFAEIMSDLDTTARLLAESVVASTSKNAEKSLKSLEDQDGFGLTLLHVVASSNLPTPTRLAGALFFKNFIKRKWIDEDGNHLLTPGNVELIKNEIVPLMITLPNNLQIQIGEAISVIADSDFPHAWPSLLQDLASRLSTDDMVTNKGVLTVAHSIFKRWRPLFRSDELFLEIKAVLDAFAVPFLNLLKNVDEQIGQNENNEASLNLLFDVLLVLVKLYYDFNCQDIPEFFEDNIMTGMGILHKYLAYKNPLLDDPEETEHAGILLKVKASIQELVQLYTARYEDVFGPMINEFIEITWNLLTSMSSQPKYDILISKSLSFLTAVSRIPKYFEFFDSEFAMNKVAEQIILPNVTLRESDIELFEDDPIEYIRRDLEGSDTDTRRRACTDFLKELKSKNEQLVTNVFLGHISKFFEQYQSNPSANWRYKDLCVFLFTALAANVNVTSTGVSATNNLLDVVDFFAKQIVPDLTQSVPNVILKVDAIKYVYVFRNQLNKSQLIEIMPILANFLQMNEYVVYTYAAVTIERILTIRQSNTSPFFIFNKTDLSDSAKILLNNLLRLILKQGSSPEKLAENEFLMRALFRVLQTSEDTVQDMFPDILGQLLNIINVIAKNPSNPRFSHYTFESIGSIMTSCPVSSLTSLADTIMPTFLTILSEDIQEFIPYVFQITAYIVEKGESVPDSIKQLAQPILSPVIWELKGNVPAVTRLLKSLIKTDQSLFSDLIPVLGVFQRLIASKAYDVYGFELLETIVFNVDINLLKPYLKQVAVLLLQRLQNSKTEKYVKKFVVFLGMVSTALGPDLVPSFIDEVQDGLFLQIWPSFVLHTLPTIGNLLDRKIALLGASNVMINGQVFANKYSSLLPSTLESIVETTASESVAHMKNDHVDLDNLEEISTFGSSFSILVSIAEKPLDPIPNVDLTLGVKAHVAHSLQKYDQSGPLLSNIASQISEDAQLKLKALLSLP